MPDDKYDDTVIHEADGIQELDNKLPRWWVLLFYISIVFGFVYMTYFHLLDLGFGQEEQWAHEMQTAAAEQAAREAENATPIDYSMPSLDAAVLKDGEKLWMANCVACHKTDGGGMIGPNMTDNSWIHGASFEENMYTISEGVLIKGMEAWKKKMSKRQMYAVASYAYTLRGTNPPGAKIPEGTVIEGSDSPTYAP